MANYRIQLKHIRRVPSLEKILDNLEKKGRVITNSKDTKYLGHMFKDFKRKGMLHFGGKGYITINPEYVMRRKKNKRIVEIVRDVTTKP